MRGVDVLLVTPPSRVEVYQELSKTFAAIEPPVWAGLIANYVGQRGVSVGMLDAEAEGFTHEQTADAIMRAQPRLAVFMIYGQQPSASTQCMLGGRKVCERLNLMAQIPTLAVGTHASALPMRTLLEEPYTFVCQGEGPATVLGLARALKSGSADFGDVLGLWYMEGDEPKHTSAAPNLANLDEDLPRQAWELIDMSKYRAHNWHCFRDLSSRGNYASLQTSLGCPYRCTFCCINAPFGGAGIRCWSPANIIAQIDLLVSQYGVRNIKIPDEMFVLNRSHVLGICDLIIERGYDLNIWAYARIDTVKDDFIEKLKRAGFNWLGIGIESGSKHVRDGVEKGRFGEPQIVTTVKKIREHGIYVAANYIFGLPDDTHETMQQTFDLAVELNTEWANFYCAMAYPGSPLYEMSKQRGWRLPDDAGGPGWIGYSQHAYDTLPLPTDVLSSTEVLDFRDQAFDRYFSHPAYLAMMGRTFGPEVVEHLNGMTAHKVKRRHRDKLLAALTQKLD